MAKLDIKLPEEFLQKVSHLAEKTDEIVPKVLEAGGAVVLPKVKSNLQAAAGSNTKYKSRSTSELVAAQGMISPNRTGTGISISKLDLRSQEKIPENQKMSATLCWPASWNTGNPTNRRNHS